MSSVVNRSNTDNAVVEPISNEKYQIRPPTARGTLAFGIQIGTLEAIFVMMEFIFGSVIFTSISQGMLSTFLPSILDPAACSFVYKLCGSLLVLAWILIRFSRSLKISVKEFLIRLRLDQFQMSSLSMKVVAAQLVGAVVMIILQTILGKWIYTCDNYWTSDGSFNLYYIMETILVAPLKEELIFRAVIVSTFYKRIGAQSSEFKIRTALISSFFFGVIHAINLFSGMYSKFYVVLQIVMGVLVGFMYSTRLLKGSLFECVLLHVLNNVISSAVTSDLSYSDPLVVFAFVETVLIYLYFNYVAMCELRAMPDCRFTPVDDFDDEELPYETEEEEAERLLKKKEKKEKKRRDKEVAADTKDKDE